MRAEKSGAAGHENALCHQSPVSRGKTIMRGLCTDRRRPIQGPSAAVAQASRYAVDGELDPGQRLLARGPRAIELHELDLHVAERIEIGKAVADRPVEQRIALKQLRLLHDRVERLDRIAPFARNAGEDFF